MSSQTKLIKDILSIYDTILEPKNISEATDIYDNVDFLDGKIKNSYPSKDNINTDLLSDIDTAAKTAGVKVDITTAISGHESLPSRHPSGNAVDIAIINGKSVSPSNRSDADKFVNALVLMGYKKNSENSSNPKSVLTFGVKGHDNHVHVSNISKELSKSGGSSKSSESGGSSFAKMIGKSLLNAVGITEEKLYSSFGDDTQTRYGSIIIPKDNNSKIKSPVEGKITSLRNSNCQNQIVILFDNDGERGYLEYCGISNPLVKYGEKVNIGTLLGKTDTDVNVTLYDSKNNRVSINTKKEKTKKTPVDIDISDLSNKNEYSKLLIKTYRKLKKPFENVKDKEGNVVQKRWSSPTEKEQPVDWINRLSPTYNKKLKEDINRIKGLLK